MAGKAKPPWRGRKSQNKRASNCLENNTKTPSRQVVIPGTALTAFLKRFRAELLDCEPSREISTALDCVDYLLSLVEVRHG